VKTLLLGLVTLLFAHTQHALAQEPIVGREAAAKYFGQQRAPTQESLFKAGGVDHYLALHFGRYMDSDSYEWGTTKEDNVGGNTFGVTYRIGEWLNSMDLAIRIDYNEYKVSGEKPTKISFMPVIMFPDATSRFPLYFGAGAGLGVFLKQVDRKSAVSFDYQLIAGARFLDVFENTGFFVEAGIKNHLHLLSSGQMNGTFLATGLVFTF